MSFPSPDLLGRGAVVAPGGPTPRGFEQAERVVIDDALLADEASLAATVDRLHRRWVTRQPSVIELAVDDQLLRQPETSSQPPYLLGATFTFLRERLHFLVWANAWDCRADEPVWWWGRKAERLGARPDGSADVILEDGTHVWIDGGPREPLPVATVHAESITLGSLVPQPPPTDPPQDLAADQREAVAHGAGAARIIAPAGSGKTKTLTSRLLHLLDDRRIEPEIVTAVAYNVRAKDEMSARIDRRDVTVRTIHSLGWAILREAKPGVTMLDEREVRQRLERLVPGGRRPNTDVIGPYLEALSQVRIGFEAPETVETERDDVPDFAAIYRMYRQSLDRRGEVDHDEQIFGAVEALLADPELRRRWQGRCRHLLVDEFQDLTPAYLLLVRLVASPGLTVFGVGDDDQTIYGYAGASPRFLIEFDRLFPAAGSHALEVNYRCPAPVVGAAARLLSSNRQRIPKTILPGPSAVADPESLTVAGVPGLEMGAHAAQIVADWLADGVPARDIAVLSRVNSALLPVHAALSEVGIGFDSPLSGALLDRTVMRGALAWLRLAGAPEAMSRRDLMEAVRRPHRRLNRIAGDLLSAHPVVSIDDLVRLGRDLDGRQGTAWDGWVADLRILARAAATGDVRATLDVLVNQVGLDRAAHALDLGRTRADRAAQYDDVVALRRTAEMHPELSTFQSWLTSVLTTRSSEDGVLLTTIHRVKGMEWNRVIVFGADRGLIPHDLSTDIEEERRVFHVAVTRCRDMTMVLADESRPSPFVAELEGRAVESEKPPAEQAGRVGVAVSVGDEIRVSGGFAGRVLAATAEGVEIELRPGPGRLSVRWGETVSTRDGSGPLVPIRAVSAPLDEELYERLRAWRLDMAQRRNVPAYVVFNDATLEEIARNRPTSEGELAAIKGIGPSKLDTYGEDLLDLVAGT